MLKEVIITVLLLVNIVGFALSAIDKYKAKNRLWRIPEKIFFWIAFLGGCPGVYAGLLLFRHKTRHWHFMGGIPLIFLLQILVVYYFVF